MMVKGFSSKNIKLNYWRKFQTLMKLITRLIISKGLFEHQQNKFKSWLTVYSLIIHSMINFKYNERIFLSSSIDHAKILFLIKYF